MAAPGEWAACRKASGRPGSVRSRPVSRGSVRSSSRGKITGWVCARARRDRVAAAGTSAAPGVADWLGGATVNRSACDGLAGPGSGGTAGTGLVGPVVRLARAPADGTSLSSGSSRALGFLSDTMNSPGRLSTSGLQQPVTTPVTATSPVRARPVPVPAKDPCVGIRQLFVHGPGSRSAVGCVQFQADMFNGHVQSGRPCPPAADRDSRPRVGWFVRNGMTDRGPGYRPGLGNGDGHRTRASWENRPGVSGMLVGASSGS